MKNAKRNNNLLEQIEIQKKIIEELNRKNTLLENEIHILKEINMNRRNYAKICDKCGKLFLFTQVNCCN
jgi:formylmethanofuran dehydrogenase subunit E